MAGECGLLGAPASGFVMLTGEHVAVAKDATACVGLGHAMLPTVGMRARVVAQS